MGNYWIWRYRNIIIIIIIIFIIIIVIQSSHSNFGVIVNVPTVKSQQGPQTESTLLLHSYYYYYCYKQSHRNVLFKRFLLNGHALGFQAKAK